MSERVAKSKQLFTSGRAILSVSITDIINLILCYAMSACSIMNSRTPFALSAYAASFLPGKWIGTFLFSVMGLIRFRADMDALFYIVSMIGATFFMGILGRGTASRAVFITLFLAVSSVIRNVINAAYWYDYLLMLAECAVCFFGVYVFDRAVPLIAKGRERRYILDTEIISVYVLIAMAVRCTANIPLVFGMDVSVILAITVLFVINLGGDISSASAMGIVLGFVAGSNGETIASVGAFAFASLTSGIFKRFGKWGVVMGFVLANTILSAFYQGEYLPFDIFEVITSAIIFALLPDAVTGYLSSLPAKTVHMATKAFVQQDKLRTKVATRLNALADSYKEVSESYVSELGDNSMSQGYIIHMLDNASSKICPSCGLKYNCWERCVKESYKGMFEMLEVAEKKGFVEESDVPPPFCEKCIKIKDFVGEFNRMYRVYKVEKIWRQRTGENRHLMSNLLLGVSQSVKMLGREFMMYPDIPTEKELKTRLDKEKTGINDVTFLKSDEDYIAEITVNQNSIGDKEKGVIANAVGEITKSDTVLVNTIHAQDGIKLLYKKAGKYKVSLGNASACRNGETVCGDSFTALESPTGNVVAAISDGMGTGKSAKYESMTAIGLLNSFVSSGIEIKTALNVINSSLIVTSLSDSFATMDVCCINRHSGKIDIYKFGAATGYVKTSDGVFAVCSECLPFGVISDFGEIQCHTLDAEDVSMIVLMSDGVTDAINYDGEDRIIKRIQNIQTDNPQYMASQLINDALSYTNQNAKDDMTVIAISVWSN